MYDLMETKDRVLRRWKIEIVLMSVIIFLATTAGLRILGVPYSATFSYLVAALFAAVFGVCCYVPFDLLKVFFTRLAIPVALVMAIWVERSEIGSLLIYCLGVSSFALLLIVVAAAALRNSSWGRYIFMQCLKGTLYAGAFLFFKNEETKTPLLELFLNRVRFRLAAAFREFRETKNPVWEP